MAHHAPKEAITIQKQDLKVNFSRKNSANMSQTTSITECYNTKIIPMRSGRGIAGAHVKYKRGDDGSDRVLCVAPQFISGQAYIISATNEDGRDDDESLTPFNFEDTHFEGFTASKQEVVVEPVYNGAKIVLALLLSSKRRRCIMNIQIRSCKTWSPAPILNLNRKQNRSSKYFFHTVFGTFPEKDHSSSVNMSFRPPKSCCRQKLIFPVI